MSMSNPTVERLLKLCYDSAQTFIELEHQAELVERDTTISPVVRQACADIRASLDHAFGKARFLMSLKDHGSGSSVTDL